MDLLESIVRCQNLEYCVRNPDASHPCAKLVATQRVPWEDRHVPEPWSGDLEKAPVLMIGSNPGYGQSEKYPNPTWDMATTRDFFVNRFGGGKRAWVRKGLYPLLKTEDADNYKKQWVHYWATARSVAREIYETEDVRSGVDYALSEVVHCKSPKESDIGDALGECARLYLTDLLAQSGAVVVIAFGDVAARALRSTVDLAPDSGIIASARIGDRTRHFLFLPHPNARKTRKLSRLLPAEELQRLRKALGGADSNGC